MVWMVADNSNGDLVCYVVNKKLNVNPYRI